MFLDRQRTVHLSSTGRRRPYYGDGDNAVTLACDFCPRPASLSTKSCQAGMFFRSSGASPNGASTAAGLFCRSVLVLTTQRLR
jgi:hypothetical protein